MSKKKIYGHLALLKLGQIVACDCTLDNAAKRVFLILAGYAAPDGTCFPSVSKIAKELGVSRTAVSKQIRILEKHHYIKKSPCFCEETHRRKTNIYRFNIELAEAFYDQPFIYSHRNVTSVVTFLATAWSYMGMEPTTVTNPVTSESCIKRIREKNNLLKKHSKKTKEAFRKANINARAWNKEKEREERTGITKEQKDEFDAVYNKLRATMSSLEITKFDTEITSSLKSKTVTPAEALKIKTDAYKAKLAE